MAKTPSVARTHPLGEQSLGGADIHIQSAPVAYRCSLRAGPRSISSLSKALGLALPKEPKSSAIKGTRSALWLGPDEWLIIDEKSDPSADLLSVKALHSAVDISHRNTAIIVTGPRAADVINAGCPQNLSLEVFPVGACSRTIFGKVEIVLHRTEPDTFRVEVWRSFSAYAFDLLSAAARSG